MPARKFRQGLPVIALGVHRRAPVRRQMHEELAYPRVADLRRAGDAAIPPAWFEERIVHVNGPPYGQPEAIRHWSSHRWFVLQKAENPE